MTTDASTSTTTNSSTTTLTNWFETTYPDSTPLVRYGYPRDDGGQTQELKLRSLYEPIPDEAITSSAIYFVTDNQLSRLDEFADNPYAIKGNSNIVKEVQDECENADRVRYPVYAESDARDDGVPFTTMIGWLREFIEDELNASSADCTFWYSGSRSIHVHLPKFLTHTQVTEIRERAKQFCEESGAELDTGIYKGKQQFRLPGVTHRKSAGALQKVQIDPSWQNDKIIHKSSRTHSLPDSYLDMLETTFTPNVDEEEFILTLDAPAETEIETPLIERVDEFPEDPYDVPKWAQYNDPEYSPYALAAGNPRSVAALEVKGGAFARADRRDGAPMVPAWFLGAVGCDGDYTKEAEHAPLQLSHGRGKDYEKWTDHDFEAGDHVVIIGGQSRSSIILPVPKVDALRTGYHLTREDGGRTGALECLSSQGYDVGASGSKRSTASSGATPSSGATRIFPARPNKSGAEALQRQAEYEGIETLSYREQVRVACRHLRQGWNPTWEWFEEQYGDGFNPSLTWSRLKGIVENPEFPEYEDVDVPPEPQ